MVRSAQIETGRRWVVVLEPGEEILSTVGAWAAREGVDQALVSFFGAFRWVRMIGAEDPVTDPEPPLPEAVEVAYVEGVGSGSIAPAGTGTRVHLHAAVGVKDQRTAGFAGHILAAEAHYTVEISILEVTSPGFVLEPDERAYGLSSLTFSGAVRMPPVISSAR